MPSDGARLAKFGWGALLVSLAIAWIAWGDVMGLGLFGWDTFPLIEAGRFSNFEEFGGALSSELMEGRFPGGHYWRPLVHLSFGIDHALWGMNARGYHTTDWLILALNASLVIALAQLLVGRERVGWAWFAGLMVFLLHGVQFEVVPMPPRRADALCLMFTLLATWLAARKAGRLSIGASIAALCAVASKETGALAPVVMFAFAAAGTRGALKERAVSGVRGAWVAVALVGLFLAVRQQVVGGLGGGAKTALPDMQALVKAGGRYAELVLAPLPPEWMPDGDFALALGLAMLVVLGLGVARAKVERTPENEAAFEPRAALAAIGVWTLALLALTAGSGVYRAWYALPLAAPLALLVALAAANRRAPGGGGSFRVLGSIVVLGLLQGWASDTRPRWDELEASSDAARRFLERFDVVVTSLEPGSTAELPAEPPEESSRRHGEETKRTLVFREYSLAAYAELVHPGRKIRVEVARDEEFVAEPDEVLVILLPKPPDSIAR